jgi:hypothetical protein
MDEILQRLKKLFENAEVTITAGQPVDDEEPFLSRDRTEQEKTDFAAGYRSGESVSGIDDTKSDAWQRGWAEAQE